MSRNTAADAARRRQAIYLGLTANLTDAQAQQGLRLWDSGYAQLRASAIIDFVSELAMQLDLTPKQRHEVRMGLYQALLKYDAGRESPAPGAASAPPQPATTQPAATPPAAGPAAPESAMFAVFRRVATDLLDGVRSDGSAAMHDFTTSLAAPPANFGLRPEEVAGLVAWAKGADSLGSFAKAREERLARAVHLLYVAAAEALGPVAADRLLSQAVTAAESMPEARKFPPKRFL